MTSGKTSKQLRRAQAAPPPVRSARAPGRRRASPRVLLGAGAVVVLVAVAIVLAVVLGHGGSSSTPTTVPAVGSLANALPGAADVNAELKGVPQHGTTLGSGSAPVTLVEFIDLQCPYCRQFETQVFPSVVAKYVRTGKLKVVMQPWAFIGPDSTRGQAAVLAAARQNKAFDYAALLYANQGTENTGWLSDEIVTSAAASIPGLQVQKLLEERSSAATKAEAQKVAEAAQARNVTGTPTLFVGKTGTRGAQVTLRAPNDEATLVQAIRRALAS